VAVAEHGGLGFRCRAAREQQDPDLLGVDEGVLARDGPGDGRRQLTLGHDVLRTAGPEPLDLVVVRDHQSVGHAPDDPDELLVGGPVIDRCEGHAGQGGTEEGDGEHVGVEAEVADRLGTALLEVEGGPSRALEELGGGDAAVVGAEDDPLGVALGCHLEQHGDVHARASFAQSEAGSGLAPLTARIVSPTEMDPSPALVHRSSRPSSSSL